MAQQRRQQQPQLATETSNGNAVRVEEGRIIVNPSKMTERLGYPLVFEGRHWWVEKVDGTKIRYYRGPRARI